MALGRVVGVGRGRSGPRRCRPCSRARSRSAWARRPRPSCCPSAPRGAGPGRGRTRPCRWRPAPARGSGSGRRPGGRAAGSRGNVGDRGPARAGLAGGRLAGRGRLGRRLQQAQVLGDAVGGHGQHQQAGQDRRCRAAPAPAPGARAIIGPPPGWVGPGKPTCRCPWWPASVNQGRPPKGQGEPTSLGCTPARPRPIHSASRRAAALAGLTGRPSTWSTSTPRQTLWLETRRVPLTNQEWPVRRHDTRIRWLAGGGHQQPTDPAVQPRGPVVAGGRHPAALVKLSPDWRPGWPAGSGAAGRGDGRQAAGDQAAERLWRGGRPAPPGP